MSENQRLFEKLKNSREVLTAARRADVAFMFRSLMVASNLKNVDIAQRLGVSEANVSRWLRGNQNLSLDTLHALADALAAQLVIEARAANGADMSSDCEEWSPAPSAPRSVYDFCAYRDLRSSAMRGRGSSFVKPMSEVEQEPRKDDDEPALAVG